MCLRAATKRALPLLQHTICLLSWRYGLHLYCCAVRIPHRSSHCLPACICRHAVLLPRLVLNEKCCATTFHGRGTAGRLRATGVASDVVCDAFFPSSISRYCAHATLRTTHTHCRERMIERRGTSAVVHEGLQRHTEHHLRLTPRRTETNV